LHLRGELAKAGQNPPRAWRPSVHARDQFWREATRIHEGFHAAALAGEQDALPVLGDWAQGVFESPPPDGYLIVDAPALPISRALTLAPEGLLVHVISADPQSLTRVLEWRRDLSEIDAAGEDWRVRYILNQVDPRRPLCRDLASIAAQALGADLISQLSVDACVPSAAAEGALIADYAPYSQVAYDIAALADLIDPVVAPEMAPEALTA
jgi:hypothetical protein